eukprot:362727-Chlamydomonas_euryale.AAC.4
MPKHMLMYTCGLAHVRLSVPNGCRHGLHVSQSCREEVAALDAPCTRRRHAQQPRRLWLLPHGYEYPITKDDRKAGGQRLITGSWTCAP